MLDQRFSVNNGIPEEDASFFVAILGDEKVCPWDEKLLKYVCKPHIVRMCFGALISHSHVLSSAECLKKFAFFLLFFQMFHKRLYLRILLKNTKVAVIFSKPNGDHETADSFPFQEVKKDPIFTFKLIFSKISSYLATIHQALAKDG